MLSGYFPFIWNVVYSLCLFINDSLFRVLGICFCFLHENVSMCLKCVLQEQSEPTE